MKKCYVFFCILFFVCILAGCKRSVNSQNNVATSSPTAPLSDATPSQPNTDTAVEFEQTTPSPPMGSPQADKDLMPEPDSREQYKVSSSSEFQSSIGSNREILLLPGDYKDRMVISDVSNLTITGMPPDDMEYIDLQNTILFTNCAEIKVSNLSIIYYPEGAGCIEFTDSHDVSINHCEIFCSNLPSYNSSGIKLKNVNDFVCSNTVIKGHQDNINLYLTRDAAFIGCTFIGGPLQIGDALNDGPCENIVIRDCALMCEAGICATWSNYVPIADKTGYEIDIGTEDWNERRFLTAIVYNDQISTWSGLRYINTYDGSIDIYEDGKILSLADKLNKTDSVKAFPSIDYIVAEDADWNQYYSYYGKPESVKLNINILEYDNKPDIAKMMHKIMELSKLGNDILSFDCPITIVYRNAFDDANINTGIIAYAEFSNKSFKEFLSDEDIGKWKMYCNVIIPAGSPVTNSSFFDLESVNKNNTNISGLFLTNSVETENGLGQLFNRLFTIGINGRYYDISALESFAGAGDFMHYYTDLIIVEDRETNDIYIASDDYYKIVMNSSADKEIIIKALNQLSGESDNPISGDICKDVLLFVENKDMTQDMINFIFLTASEDTSGYADYIFYYYIATYDINSGKVSRINPVGICSFKEIISNTLIEQVTM
ncbi:MAG: hypothetical protein ACOYIF_01555 [Acetivibrionales bacterium]|jgi:hypothetical protein